MMYLSRKKWCIAQYDKDCAASLAEACGLDPFAALLLVSRGIKTPEQAHGFLEDDPAEFDPMCLPDMDRAVARIRKALDHYERIAVYGDYDADGVTATAVLYSYLETQGADVFYDIPERETEGYGLHRASIDEMARRGAKLIITVDNGVSALEEAEYAASLGLDLIITDHHRAGDTLPRAEAIVDAHRTDCNCPFRDLAGVGVAFYLAAALEGDAQALLDDYADLVALGTIADVVPLYGENRRLVRCGLARINANGRPGLTALREAAGFAEKALTAVNVAFTLAPRINAAGRMGSAQRALRLLLSEDEAEAASLAEEICQTNALRQETEQAILRQVELQLDEHPQRRFDRVLVVAGEGWHPGVLGIVAARLTESYGRPSVVITTDGDLAKGSGRSIEGFSLYDALKASESALLHFGGHTLAAGLELKSGMVDMFRSRINEYAAQADIPFPILRLDCRLNPVYLTLDMIDAVGALEPFGAGNPQPLFGLFRMRLEAVQPVGGGKHLRLRFSRGGTQITAMCFGITPAEFPYCIGDVVDLAVRAARNEFRGKADVSVQIHAMRLAGLDEDALFEEERLYEAYRRGELHTVEEAARALPSRDQTAQVYRMLRANAGWRFGAEMLCLRLAGRGGNLCQVMVALDAMEELHLIQRGDGGNILLPPDTIKVNLDDSLILQSLRAIGGDGHGGRKKEA